MYMTSTPPNFYVVCPVARLHVCELFPYSNSALNIYDKVVCVYLISKRRDKRILLFRN